MAKNEQTLQATLHLIADILSFETSNALLEKRLMNKTIDWDKIVIVASRHLMLPAIYCRLHQKKLLHHLPVELVDYLEELTNLNRTRNKQLLAEALEISKLFDTHHIRYAYIKGIAILSGNYYKDIGERMIGDIDILVDSEHLDSAFDVLVAQGYSRFVEFNYKVKNYRHLPRQISDSHLGAVELHDQLLKHGHNSLIDKEQLLETAKMSNGMRIPITPDLIKNAIFAKQINDDGYSLQVLGLKNIYDVLALGLNQHEDLLKQLYSQKYSSRFLNQSALFFPELGSPGGDMNSFERKLFLMKMKHPKLGNLIYKLTYGYLGAMERFQLFLYNRSYREHIIKMLK